MIYTVALVDDDEFNLKIAKKILNNNDIEVMPFTSGYELLDYLKNDTPNLILLDIMMPGMDGFETLKKVRELENELDLEDIPVIFLTSDEDNESESKGFEMGISDYIRKPFQPTVLIKRITNILKREEILQRYHEEATIDTLTGLLNKGATNNKLEMLCKRKPGYLMMIDLDAFKLVNDIYGHDAGDKILISFSILLKGFLGQDDVIGRMGGDEFTAFSTTLKSEEDIKNFSNNLNEIITIDAKRILGDNMDIPLGASIGAIYLNGQGEDYIESLKKADKALYNTKNNGKHGYSIYDETSEPEEDDTLNLKNLSMILSERNITSTALKLDSSSFMGVYRFVMRYIMQYHRNACKLLITLSPGEHKDSAATEELYESFGQTMEKALRKSDLMMQVRKNVFFVILTDIKEVAVEQVVGNIIRKWNEQHENTLNIKYETEFLESEKIYTGEGDNLWVAVVDDDMLNLKLAEKILSKSDINVTKLQSGYALLEFLKTNRPDLILLDVNMPDMDGFETLTKLRGLETDIADIPVVFLTSENDVDTEKKALGLGAKDFIKKPFIPEILTLRVKQIAELLRLQKRLSDEVARKTKENEELFLDVVSSLAGAIDAKDTYTNGHSSRVADYSKEIARRYGYNMKEQSDIYIMGLLHDVGKIGVPDSIINKPGKLTDEEFEQIKVHPVIGSQILKNIKKMPKLSIGARWHHERFNGTGYPDKLKGEEIPEEARIIAVADAYDAMSSKRSYRGIMPQEKIRNEILKGSGTQFDPRFAEIMIRMIDDDTDYKMREDGDE
ncbi:diguanylate cyclase (GGDEF) domain-containing protein [Eubacterium ruminantium]|nr:diguanylate cyclase (GGDEF) domain-containing protein [Eubacterium ruminantium]